MTKLNLLRFLSQNEGVTVRELADEFSYEEGSIRAYMNWLSSRGLIKKVKEDNRLSYSITTSGKRTLDFLEEREDKNDENLEENKPSGGVKMSKQIVSNDEASVWVCPSCDTEYELTFPVDEDDLYCETCDELLQPCEDDDSDDVDEPVRRGR